MGGWTQLGGRQGQRTWQDHPFEQEARSSNADFLHALHCVQEDRMRGGEGRGGEARGGGVRGGGVRGGEARGGGVRERMNNTYWHGAG